LLGHVSNFADFCRERAVRVGNKVFMSRVIFTPFATSD